MVSEQNAIVISPVMATYLGDQRAALRSGGRQFLVDQRTNVGRAGAKFCPLELIVAAYAS